jgi:hypothetical protein
MRGIFKAVRALVFGGCRHKNMGWPIWLEGHSYRVCLDCGIKRLFDEETMRGYGPYSYHTSELLRTTARLNVSRLAIMKPAR